MNDSSLKETEGYESRQRMCASLDVDDSITCQAIGQLAVYSQALHFLFSSSSVIKESLADRGTSLHGHEVYPLREPERDCCHRQRH